MKSLRGTLSSEFSQQRCTDTGCLSLVGETVVDVSNGTARFENLYLYSIAKFSYRLQFMIKRGPRPSDIDAISISNPFKVYERCSDLQILTQPGQAGNKGYFRQQPRLRLIDKYGDLASWHSLNVSVQLSGEIYGSCYSCKLFGTTELTAINGIVEFTDLSFNSNRGDAVIGILLIFSALDTTNVIRTVSNPFLILPSAHSIELIQQPPLMFSAGTTVSIIARVYDWNGEPARYFNSEIEISTEPRVSLDIPICQNVNGSSSIGDFMCSFSVSKFLSCTLKNIFRLLC